MPDERRKQALKNAADCRRTKRALLAAIRAMCRDFGTVRAVPLMAEAACEAAERATMWDVEAVRLDE